MGEFPAAIATKDDYFIAGELYRIKQENEFSWAIGQLDDYEGMNTEAGEVQLYHREIAEVYVNNWVTQAWVYWYKGDVEGKPMIVSGDVLEFLDKKRSV